jgi:hypothetical protein
MENKNENGVGLGCRGFCAKMVWAEENVKKSFWNFFSAVLNLKPKLKFKSNTFSNSNKFKYFQK